MNLHLDAVFDGWEERGERKEEGWKRERGGKEGRRPVPPSFEWQRSSRRKKEGGGEKGKSKKKGRGKGGRRGREGKGEEKKKRSARIRGKKSSFLSLFFFADGRKVPQGGASKKDVTKKKRKARFLSFVYCVIPKGGRERREGKEKGKASSSLSL